MTRRFFFSSAQRLLCDNSLPITYNGRGPHVVFGENGKYVTEEQLSEGAVIDMDAARLLMARGVDVGIERMSEEREQAGEEYFEADDEYVATTGAPRSRRHGGEAMANTWRLRKEICVLVAFTVVSG